MTQLEIIGNNIRRYRESINMDQGDLADKLGISRKTISAWENGRSCPRMGVAEQMMSIFNCTLTDILSEPGTEVKPDIVTSASFGEVLFEMDNKDAQRLNKVFNKLSPENQEKLLKFATDLLVDQ